MASSSKIKCFNFVICVATKKVGQKFFPPFPYVAVFGSGWKKTRIQDKHPGSAKLVMNHIQIQQYLRAATQFSHNRISLKQGVVPYLLPSASSKHTVV